MVLLAFYGHDGMAACQPIPAAAARRRNQLLQALPPSGLLTSDKCQPFVFGEVSEVLGVECRKRELIDQAAGGYPGVVVRPGTSAPLRAGLELSPPLRHRFVVFQGTDTLTPSGQIRGAARSPGPQHPPLHQLPDRDEGDAHRVACQRRPQRIGQAVAQAGGCDVGVQDDQAHGMLARREA